MPWSESDALAFMNGSKTFDEVESSKTSQPSEETTEPTGGNVEPAATDTDKVETSTVTEPEEGKSTSSDDVENPEKVDKSVENKKGGQKKYTPEQKTKHAFQKQKARIRQFKEENEALRKELEDLKANLEKYKGLKKEDFNGDDDAYQDYKIDQRFGQEKAERLQKELEAKQLEQQRAEQAEIAQYRLEQCFPDEQSRDEYQQLIYKAETGFDAMHPEIGYKTFTEFLQKEDTDGTLIGYLQDSDYSPKLIRHFIHKPDAALKIMRLRNPLNKMIELKQLENRMIQFERLQAAKAAEPKPEPKQLPSTGKVVSNNVNEQTNLWDKKSWSEKDALAYIKQRG